MCAPPCGFRRSSRRVVRCERPEIITTITKKEVDEIIANGDFKCEYRFGDSKNNEVFEGCSPYLLKVLHNGKTKVKVAGYRSPEYKDGFRTVIMKAPEYMAVYLLRIVDNEG